MSIKKKKDDLNIVFDNPNSVEETARFLTTLFSKSIVNNILSRNNQNKPVKTYKEK